MTTSRRYTLCSETLHTMGVIKIKVKPRCSGGTLLYSFLLRLNTDWTLDCKWWKPHITSFLVSSEVCSIHKSLLHLALCRPKWTVWWMIVIRSWKSHYQGKAERGGRKLPSHSIKKTKQIKEPWSFIHEFVPVMFSDIKIQLLATCNQTLTGQWNTFHKR